MHQDHDNLTKLLAEWAMFRKFEADEHAELRRRFDSVETKLDALRAAKDKATGFYIGISMVVSGVVAVIGKFIG